MRTQAITNLYLNAVTFRGNKAYTQNETIIKLDEVLITAEVTRLQAEYDANQYQRDRAEAYPSLTEQADMAYWDRQNGTTTLDDAISAVKLQFPKG
jgi:hypothetical protein